MKRGLLILSVAIAVLLCACTGSDSQSVESSSSVASSQASSTAVSMSSSESTSVKETQESVTLAENAGIELEDITDMTQGFEAVGLFQNGYAVAYKDGEVGYMNLEGEYQALYSIPLEQLLLNPTFHPLIPTYNGGQGDKLGLISFLHNSLACSKDGIVPYYEDGKWGYSDVQGNIIVPPTYEYVKPFGENYGVAYRLKTDGETYPTQFRLEMVDKNGNIVATSDDSLYCHDAAGVYFTFTPSSNEQMSMGTLEMYNVQGKLLYQEEALNVNNFGYVPTNMRLGYEGYIVLNPQTGTCDLYDYDGNQIASGIEKDVINVNKNGWFIYTDNEKYGLGNVSNPEFLTGLESCSFPYDGTIQTKADGVWTVYDQEGNEVTFEAVWASQEESQSTDTMHGNPVVITDANGEELGRIETDFSIDSDSFYWSPYEKAQETNTNGLYVLQNGEAKLYRLSFTK